MINDNDKKERFALSIRSAIRKALYEESNRDDRLTEFAMVDSLQVVLEGIIEKSVNNLSDIEEEENYDERNRSGDEACISGFLNLHRRFLRQYI